MENDTRLRNLQASPVSKNAVFVYDVGDDQSNPLEDLHNETIRLRQENLIQQEELEVKSESATTATMTPTPTPTKKMKTEAKKARTKAQGKHELSTPCFVAHDSNLFQRKPRRVNQPQRRRNCPPQ